MEEIKKTLESNKDYCDNPIFLKIIDNVEEINKRMAKLGTKNNDQKLKSPKEIFNKLNEMEEQILLLCEAHENDLIFMNNLLEQIEGIRNEIQSIKNAINHQKT